MTNTDDTKSGIVYVLTNPAMPKLVKIGKTTRAEVEKRLGELYTTGVPEPFVCEFAVRVTDMNATEKALHAAFAPYRPNTGREFFEIKPDQAIQVLGLVSEEDVTPSVRKVADGLDAEATRRVRRRLPKWSFESLDVPAGSELRYLKDDDKTCLVRSGTRVEYEGHEITLGKLTRELLEVPYGVRPVSYWTFGGKRLEDLYEEIYRATPELDDDE